MTDIYAIAEKEKAPVTQSATTNGRKATTPFVYLFNEVEAAAARAGSWENVRTLLGGKGANLAEMTRIGVPVPPGFTITTETCNLYLKQGETFPSGLWEQVLAAVKTLEKSTGKGFGDTINPLLLSCRSGAKFSMPGMMDTVLNIGLNDDVAEGMLDEGFDTRFVYDLYRRLLQMFGSVVLDIPDEPFEMVITEFRDKRGVKNDANLTGQDWMLITVRFKEIIRQYTGHDFPVDPYQQLYLAIEAVFKLWNGKQAVDYCNVATIAHNLGWFLYLIL
jgi:pyruvate,orthophosphate dikinase